MTTFTQEEQFLLELINRARMEPDAEMALMNKELQAQGKVGNFTLNENLAAGTISSASKQVLAPNNKLATSADKHSAAMSATKVFEDNPNGGRNAHTGIGDGTPTTRAQAEGYFMKYPGNSWRDENIAWQGTMGTIDTETLKGVHRGLFVDTFDSGRGHRLTLMDDNLKEVGIGQVQGTVKPFGDPNTYKAAIVTEHFGVASTDTFITGAVYTDVNGDHFYGLGEAVANVTATVKNAAGVTVGSDVTGQGGGYSVSETGGTFTVTFSGGNLGANQVAAVVETGNRNAKVDLVNSFEINANVTATLGAGANHLRLLGMDNINGTGNAANNIIVGNKGNNILTGAGGNDTIDGGLGSDTAIFSGKQSDYKITVNGGAATLTDLRAGKDGADTITNVEFVKFADAAAVAYSTLKTTAEPAAAGAVTISDVTVTEGNSDTQIVNFVVSRTGGVAAFDVSYKTVDGTATAADGDYVAKATAIHFNEGQLTQTISIVVNGDTKVEGNETFSVVLSNPTNGARLTDATGVATITNDDAAGNISIGNVTVTEGNSGTKIASFVVTRSGGAAAFDVNYKTVDGTATVADKDYVAQTNLLHFNEGQLSQTISIVVNGDAKLEGNEAFNVVLSNATNGAKITTATGVATITNDDANNAPIVTGKAVTLAASAAISASSIFSASDADGNATISHYAFWDAGNAGGHFTVNGVAQASGQWVTVSAANLGTVKYVGAVNGGVETLFSSAFDGVVWSANASVKATTLQRAAQDFNGDGNSDVLFHNINGTVAQWQLNGTTISANKTVGTQATSWHAVDTFDFNGDGKADILWHNDNGQVQLWQMDGALTKQVIPLGSMATNWHVGGANDFNGDGKAEVLWYNDAGQVQMWNMNGAAHTTANVGTIAAGWLIKDTADFTGDGKADILLQKGTSVALWQMDGATITKSTTFATIGNGFHFAGAADFNGDAKSDILWHNDTTGQVVLWQLDGTTILSNTTVGTTAAGWEIKDLGDYNHDGRADILLQNAAGSVAEWQMDGNQLLKASGIGGVSADWHIV